MSIRPSHVLREARLFVLASAACASCATARAHEGLVPPDPGRHDVVWTTPSADAHGSVPLGNGDVALNAWVEPSGELVFYVAKSDAWDHVGRLLKVGRVRVALDPPPPMDAFEHALRLERGVLEVRYGRGAAAVRLELFVDAHHPVVVARVHSPVPRALIATIEPWRTAPEPVPQADISDLFEDRARPNSLRGEVVIAPDQLLGEAPAGMIGWYRWNESSPWFDEVVRVQGLEDYFADRPDPLSGRTFGGLLRASNGRREGPTRLRAQPASEQRLELFVATEHPSSPSAWLRAVVQRIAATDAVPAAQRDRAHADWWRAFWQRSWIEIRARDEAGAADAAVVEQAYALQRYVTACAGRGRFPIKFNGSLFTVPWEGRFGDADYRRWGPGYWWQNTRLPYHALSAAGDFESLLPLFRMYSTETLALHEFRARRYTGHGGALLPECITFWGGSFPADYGWTPFEERGTDKLQESGWHKREWVAGLELVWLMQEFFAYTEDQRFLRETLLPTAESVLTFFDEHYATGPDGRWVMTPSQALETWWDTTNPMPEVAGLQAVLERLVQLPSTSTTAAQRARWLRLAELVPALPTRVEDGVELLAPAARFADKRNVENPELYAVFPFRRVSFERANAALGLAALERRTDRGHAGWRQDELFMTHLGLADEARAGLVQRARNTDPASRFPAFWAANYDWTPDQTHGGVLMRTLQTMLLQTDGDTLFVLPAWPDDWDVRFRLHAPGRTIVEGERVDGRLERLELTPTDRARDVRRPTAASR